MKSYKAISKFLSFVLRHNPRSIGLELDANGWVSIDKLIKQANEKKGYSLNSQLLAEVVETNDKKRFSVNDYGTKIRANQGHTIKVDLELKPVIPPDIFYSLS